MCDGLGLPVEQVELSMGMSHDFKIAVPLQHHLSFLASSLFPMLCCSCMSSHHAPHALFFFFSPTTNVDQIEEGSTNVRVGSSIFGARVYHK